MAFSTSSFFAGVGTVFAAVTIGFAGGSLIGTSPKVQPPNRLERVAAGNVPVPPASAATSETPAAAKSETPVPPTQAATTETTATPSASERVTAITTASSSQETVSPPTPPVAARDDAAARADHVNKVGGSEPQIDDTRKGRESQVRKDRAEQRAARYERRKRQEIEAAANAVRQVQRDGTLQETAQRDDSPRDDRPVFGLFGSRDDSPRNAPPRLGFFGND